MDQRAWFGEGLPKGIIMLDTHESIQLRFEKMMMERSPIERLKMGCSMFDTAKEIVRSSILNKNPQASLEEIRKGIFLRFYGQDFNEVQIKNILGGLKP